jgi:hypothetical protein
MMPDAGHLKLLTAEVQTVVWISAAPLTQTTEHFETLNYILDGLPFKHLKAQGQTDSIIFSHTAFARPLWVVFMQETSKSAQQLKEQIESVIPQSAREKILVFGRPSEGLRGWLVKNYNCLEA